MTALLDRPGEAPDVTQDIPAAPDEVHEMHVGDPDRNLVITWKTGDRHAVALARRVFADRRARGYLAYRTTPPDTHETMRDFDPDAALITMQRPLQGG